MSIKPFTCLHDGCERSKHQAKGYCEKHYNQFRKHGKTFTFTSKDFNEIVDCGDHFELILLDRKMKENGRAKIDKEDLLVVKSMGRWGLHDETNYVRNGKHDIYLHRLVMNAKDGEEVDHKETGSINKLDNRKKNLRLATRQENSFNKSKQSNNKSGFKGVYSYKNGKWIAQTRYNGKLIHLGYFNSAQAASEAYNESAKLLHKNFLHKSIGIIPKKRLIRFEKRN